MRSTRDDGSRPIFDDKPNLIELIEAFDDARQAFLAKQAEVKALEGSHRDWDREGAAFATACSALNDRLLWLKPGEGVEHRGRVYQWANVVPHVLERVRTAAEVDSDRGGESSS